MRDTQIGMRDIDVATVQQMFGRAGRLGAGESVGWAFMIVDESERSHWQRKLVGGYTVASQISSSLPDQVLAEVVQGRVGSLAEAERWWRSTLAHHQGNISAGQLRQAVSFLVGAGYLARSEEVDSGLATLKAAELGLLTARVMVSAHIGYQLRSALADRPVPTDADEAEETLIELLSTVVPKLASCRCEGLCHGSIAVVPARRNRTGMCRTKTATLHVRACSSWRGARMSSRGPIA
ncbi:hypothetical protein [Streptacidiphilus sp. MAP5-3]|uniref:hypothetical protein n=1 Tax=unclassified Streptacidiphilus TaxID=2643834 RepID=UPI003516D3F3